VGVGAASAAFAYRRFGKGVAAAIGVVVFAALLILGPSRFQNLEASESSAQGRIQAWAAGLAMFKSAPVLGVGYGNYAEYNELVAHNSFVHAFAETGFIGGYFLVGLCYWFLVGNGAGRNVAGAARSRLARDIWASGIGAMACAMFLSRQYSPVFYVPLVMGAARIAVEKTEDEVAPTYKWSEWVLIVFLSVGVIISTYIAVRTLAVWSRG
jgi:O-antigen ligase